jgi:TRAP-type transport system periplasmic protein
MTIRTPVQTMTVDFFEALGAKPMRFTLNQLYEVLKNQTVDGQTDPLGLILLLKLYEVQTYLSLTNHWWSGFTLVANATAWNALPADLQAIVEKHAKPAALAQRQDIDRLNASALETLRSKGMIVNEGRIPAVSESRSPPSMGAGSRITESRRGLCWKPMWGSCCRLRLRPDR